VPSVVLHYGELALKGRNRPWFLATLVRNLKAALADLDIESVQLVVGRIVIRYTAEADWPEIAGRLAKVPGIGNFSRAIHVEPDLDRIAATVVAAVAGRTATSFRVRARRADKRFPHPSPDIERFVGERVRRATGWPVDLSHPDVVLHVEVLTDDAFFFFEKEAGAGGLPVGTGGKVLCLLSGGIDSPVAASRIIRRGCRAAFVHFHSYPILARTSQDKAREIVRRLTPFQQRSRLFLVPFGPVQQQVVVSVPPPLRVVVYRRLMLRIAERLAPRARAQAIVTGEVLGQVASQTLENLAVIQAAATLPVLRPLIGVDKEQITREAQALGTYEVSIIPDEDCCTLFTPRFPATRTRLEAVLAAESTLDVAGLVEQAAASVEIEDFRIPEPRRVAPPADRTLESAVARPGAPNSGDQT
jgi:thiamine biosynthesis protein ThiI